MTLDEFIYQHILWPRRNKIGVTPDRTRQAYDVYRRTYHCTSTVALVGLAMQADEDVMMRLSVFAAAKDRDERKAPAVVEELEPKEEKDAVTRNDASPA